MPFLCFPDLFAECEPMEDYGKAPTIALHCLWWFKDTTFLGEAPVQYCLFLLQSVGFT